MRVDFYLLSEATVESALPQVARQAKKAGERMLVVSADPAQLAALHTALWEAFPEDFLAHGIAGDRHAARQPLLLSEDCEAENGARFVAFADGRWREEGFGFDRAFLFFDDAGRAAARGTWTMLDGREGVERHFWAQEGGKWAKKR